MSQPFTQAETNRLPRRRPTNRRAAASLMPNCVTMALAMRSTWKQRTTLCSQPHQKQTKTTSNPKKQLHKAPLQDPKQTPNPTQNKQKTPTIPPNTRYPNFHGTCCRSPPAPVVTCPVPKTNCSAARPPKAPEIRASTKLEGGHKRFLGLLLSFPFFFCCFFVVVLSFFFGFLFFWLFFLLLSFPFSLVLCFLGFLLLLLSFPFSLVLCFFFVVLSFFFGFVFFCFFFVVVVSYFLWFCVLFCCFFCCCRFLLLCFLFFWGALGISDC